MNRQAADARADPPVRLALFACISAGAVAVSYLPQPILTAVRDDFGVTNEVVGSIVTSAQIGYSVGLLLLLPLADLVRPRLQVQWQLLAACAALGLAILAREPWQLALAFFFAGAASNVAQILLPLAVRWAPAGAVGRTTSVLTGALLLGMFGGRVAVGFVCELAGWRAAVGSVALVLLVLIPFARMALVRSPKSAASRPYLALLFSLPGLLRSVALRRAAAIQFLVFGAFNAVWAVSVLYFTSPAPGPNWSTGQAGLVGFAGVAAGLLTQFGGRYLDRWGHRRFLLTAAALGSVSAIGIVAGSSLPTAVIAGLLGVTLANQLTQVSNQAAILVDPALAGRTNTVYMACTFAGGACGSAAGVLGYSCGGLILAGSLAAGAMLAATSLAVFNSGARVRQFVGEGGPA